MQEFLAEQRRKSAEAASELAREARQRAQVNLQVFFSVRTFSKTFFS
jgi:hypothetical protein